MSRFYLPELDALRFFAFLCVFVGHAAAQNAVVVHAGMAHPMLGTLLGTGEFGVDLFFTLSAYLITELLCRERNRFGDVDLPSFYKRRILRIWPLYFGFLALSVAVIRFIPVMNFPWIYYPCFAFFIGNFAIISRGVAPALIGPLWSVCVEEQFYLTWPLVMRRLTRRNLIVAGVIIWIFSILARCYLVEHGYSDTALRFITFGRLDPIAAGIILSAALNGERPRLGLSTRALLFAAGALAWMTAVWCFNGPHTAGVAAAARIFSFVPVAMGCVAFVLGTIGVSRVSGPLVYLGRISYGLYIFHLLVLDLGIVAVNGFAGWSLWRWSGYTILELAVTVLIAAVSYRYFEAPFLRLKERFQHIRSGESVARGRVPAPEAAATGFPPSYAA